jgi:hypothetical protein
VVLYRPLEDDTDGVAPEDCVTVLPCTPYEATYQRVLRRTLDRHIAKARTNAASAGADLANAMLTGTGWSNQGPVAYAVSRGMDDALANELAGRVADRMQQALDAGRTPTDTLAIGLGMLRGCCDAALGRSGVSTNPWDNMVVQELAKAAHHQLHHSSSGLGYVGPSAHWQAVYELVRDEQSYQQQAKADVAEAQGKVARAKTPQSQATANTRLEKAQALLATTEADLDAALAANGVPADPS